MSATVNLIKVSYRRIVSLAPYETATCELALEAQPAPDEKILPQIRQLQEAVRLEVEAAAQKVRSE